MHVRVSFIDHHIVTLLLFYDMFRIVSDSFNIMNSIFEISIGLDQIFYWTIVAVMVDAWWLAGKYTINVYRILPSE